MSYGTSKYAEYAYGEDDRLTPYTDEYKIDLMRYLTSNYQEGSNIKKLIQLIELELGELKYYSISLGQQNSIDKATWGLNMWEDILGIEYNPSMTLENRREIIKAKLRGRGTTTKEMIKNTAEAFSGGEVDIIEYPEEYYFVVKFIGIKGIPRNMQNFIDMLEAIKPAHLAYEFKYNYTTCQMLIDWYVNCNDIKKITCTELKTYENRFNFAYTTCKFLIDKEMTCNEIRNITCLELKTYGRREIIEKN